MSSDAHCLSAEAVARRTVWQKTGEFLALLALLTMWVHLAFTSARTDSLVLSLGVAFLATQFGLMVLIMTKVFLSKGREMLSARRAAAALPNMRADLARYAGGRQGPGKLNAWHRKMPVELEACLVDFLPVLTGRQRRKLVSLATALGLVEIWQDQYSTGGVTRRLDALTKLGLVAGRAARKELRAALHDPVEGLRNEAAKALLRIGDVHDAGQVLEFALGQSMLVRAVLADDLKPHVEMLTSRIMPALDAEGDRVKLRRGLDLLRSWKCCVAFPEIGSLLRHDDPDIATTALRVLPFVVEREQFGSEVLGGLVSRRAERREAAAFCAGRLGLRSATDVLAARLRDSDPRVARAAGEALARLGAEGLERLDDALVRPGDGARFALETLERVRTGHLHAAQG